MNFLTTTPKADSLNARFGKVGNMLVYIYLLLPWPSNIYGFLGKPDQTKLKCVLNLFLRPAFYQQRTIPFEGNTLLRGCTSFEGVISIISPSKLLPQYVSDLSSLKIRLKCSIQKSTIAYTSHITPRGKDSKDIY